ncbi:MAG TPA: 4a-hydroxytetrahydrobiopterin dehydratase [Candidatus Paceibacterota bacterium]
MPTLSEEAIANLMGSVEGWQRKGNEIEKTFTFKNFKEALAFFNKVAEIAEEEGHHPDMGIFGWKNVRLNLTTHAVGGLTDNDFVMASKIDHL